MRSYLLPPAVLLALSLAGAVQGQSAGPVIPVSRAPVFHSWQSPWPAAPTGALRTVRSESGLSRRGGHALLGGAIGAVAGVAVCTVISNLAGDNGAGISTCTWKGYLLTGGIGFGVGFTVGWLL